MAGHIPENFIADLLTQIDIIDLIHQRVPLKKAGVNFKACCPFHQEKTPSFTVFPQDQQYHCFGCEAHGNAIRFLMDYDGLDFVNSVKALAEHLGIDVPQEEHHYQNKINYQSHYDLLEQIKNQYLGQLKNQPAPQTAITYLKNRSLTGEICKRFEIGYVPDQWRFILETYGKEPTQRNILLATGMLSESKGNQYDRFRNRIMFPIHDLRGRPIGFGGRVLDDTKPKYLNSPETPIFHKGEQLYGLFHARKYTKKLTRLMVVEGYMDVVALAQFDITYAVATLGTATTNNHIKLLFKNAVEIIFCFDGDNAGRNAGWKALETCLPEIYEGRSAQFLFLPDGEDPDTLVRKEGKIGFEQRITQAPTLSQFLFNKLKQDLNLNSPEGRGLLATKVEPYLSQIQAGLYLEMLKAELGKLIEAPNYNPNLTRKPFIKTFKSQRNGVIMLPSVRHAIILLLRYPETVLENYQQSERDWQHVKIKGINIIKQIIKLIQQHNKINTETILEHWKGTNIGYHLATLSYSDSDSDDISNDDVSNQFNGILKQISQEYCEQEVAVLLTKTENQRLTTEEDKKLRYFLAQLKK